MAWTQPALLTHRLHWLVTTVCIILLVSCDSAPNDPYPHAKPNANTYYTAFSEQPKTLDPASSYSANESLFTAQIYEPPLQYHYLKRPYTLEPLTATALPVPIYYDVNGDRLAEDTDPNSIDHTIYHITIHDDILYQPHPAFAKDKKGRYRYHHLDKARLKSIDTLSDFKYTDTRYLRAQDYVYQIKRLANPLVQSPILGVMSDYIIGLRDYSEKIRKMYPKIKTNLEPGFIDLRRIPLEGATVIDDNTYQIKIHGYYPQLLFWLAMPFFAPMPWEADAFYSQPGMRDKNITLDWYPVGTGPYMLTENNPNRRMVLTRNPNFRASYYPDEGSPSDHQRGLLAKAGQRIPFIDRFEFTLEKESIPQWTKFLQGYYDQSGVSADSFDQAIDIATDGRLVLEEALQQKGIKMRSQIGLSIFYYGFNMLDPVIGGDSERARLLRQAISLALDQEEYISVFLNGRGVPAQGPLPPGIFGYLAEEAGYNPYQYDWQDGNAKRKPLSVARELLKKAGYPNGRDPKTGESLLINFDVPSSHNPDDKARFLWMRKQLAKIGIQLSIRATQYNHFQEKMRNGNAQLFFWGWQADYPDPENFLFLLYGPNGKVNHGGENAANYHNPAFDRLFEKMRLMPDGKARQDIINNMVDIARHDAPWIWGFHPKELALQNPWLAPIKPSQMTRNHLKYMKLDPQLRDALRQQWNQPVLWPLWWMLAVLALLIVPVVIWYQVKQRKPPKMGKL